MGEQPPPRELESAWSCQLWGALPETGGLREQLAGELRRMETALATYNAVRAWNAAYHSPVFGAANRWQRDHPELWKVVQQWLALSGRIGT